MKVTDEKEAEFLQWCEREGVTHSDTEALAALEVYRSIVRAAQAASMPVEEYTARVVAYLNEKGE